MDKNSNLNKNKEISEALKELNSSHLIVGKSQTTMSSDDVAKKAREAFREFELKKREDEELQQTLTPANLAKLEIKETLKEFEERTALEEQQKQSKKNLNTPKGASSMVRLVMKLSGGLITEERTAEYILLGLAALFFLTSGYFFFTNINGNNQKAQQLSPEMLDQMKQIQKPQQSNN